MSEIFKINDSNIEVSTKIYMETYSKEPWNEEYNFKDVKSYISRFLSIENNRGWILYDGNKAIGVVLGIIIPTTRKDYFRIEDLCIVPDKQHIGYGSEFIKIISSELKSYDVDSIILNTVGDFPAYKFYLKNNFKDIDTSRTLYLNL
ncbi:MAG: GNAT family N-acetyltransferase [Clostridiaceae bacterium]|nr:GNAT family N-acetyltransferase [Clostridiaceae bacterium]